MFKNVASQKWMVFAWNRLTNEPVTGDAAQITAKIRQDYGTRTASNDTNPTELEDGYYEFDLTQAETNGDELQIFPESSTSNVQVVGCPATIYTTPQYFPDLGIGSDGDLLEVNTLTGHTVQTGDSFARIGATGSGLTSLAQASVLGAVADAAADGDPTASETLMQYVKQLVNVLVGTAGVVTYPAAAAPGNGVSLAEVIRAIYDDSNELQGDWTDAGRLDALLDAVKAITDQFVFTAANQVDAQVVAMATGVLDANALATDAGQEIADRVLLRNIGSGSDGGRDVRSALRVLRNRVAISGGTMTVYEEDDTSPSWTSTITTAAGDPISESNPA